MTQHNLWQTPAITSFGSASQPSTVNRHHIAELVCTHRELEVWRLSNAGFSTRQISTAVNLSRWTIRDHLANANRKISHAEDTTD